MRRLPHFTVILAILLIAADDEKAKGKPVDKHTLAALDQIQARWVLDEQGLMNSLDLHR